MKRTEAYAPAKKIRQSSERILRGEAAGPGKNDAVALMTAVDKSGTHTVLYRGMAMPKADLDAFKSQNEVTLGVSSFSKNYHFAKVHASKGYPTRHPLDYETVVLEVRGAKGVDLSKRTPNGTRNAEVVTYGKFRVVSKGVREDREHIVMEPVP